MMEFELITILYPDNNSESLIYKKHKIVRLFFTNDNLDIMD
jgi:hypothetical protein